MNKEEKALLEKKYPPGSRIILLEMKDDPHPVPSGTEGTVTMIDDMCQIQVNWDNGSTLALIDHLDRFTGYQDNPGLVAEFQNTANSGYELEPCTECGEINYKETGRMNTDGQGLFVDLECKTCGTKTEDGDGDFWDIFDLEDGVITYKED